MTGHTYQITFDTTNQAVVWDCRDVDENAYIITNQAIQGDRWDYPIFDGVMARIIWPSPGLITGVWEIAGAGGVPLDPRDSVAYDVNSTGDWNVTADRDSLEAGRLRWNYQGNIQFEKWEFRFVAPGNGSQYFNWGTDELFVDTLTSLPLVAPFEVWDIGMYGFPWEQRRIQFALLDDDESGGWSYGDRIYPFERDYYEPLPSIAEYDFPGDFFLGRVKFNDLSGTTAQPAAGTIVLFETSVLPKPGDVYEFHTRPPYQGITWDLDNVKVVPNPYYGHSNYEMNPYDKVVKFTNLPREVTIRIFNLGGDHIKTLTKNNTSTELIWNLETKYNIPVASGIYIWYLDAPGIGTKEGKTAIFMERETLTTF